MCFSGASLSLFPSLARARAHASRAAERRKKSLDLRIFVDTKCNRRAQRFPLCSQISRVRDRWGGRKIEIDWEPLYTGQLRFASASAVGCAGTRSHVHALMPTPVHTNARKPLLLTSLSFCHSRCIFRASFFPAFLPLSILSARAFFPLPRRLPSGRFGVTYLLLYIGKFLTKSRLCYWWASTVLYLKTVMSSALLRWNFC